MKNVIKYTFSIALLTTVGCQHQLDIDNPNQPTLPSVQSELGIISLAQGALYVNGFRANKFGGSYFGVVLRYHEAMGDIIGVDFANFEFNLISCPDQITLDDNTTLNSVNPKGQVQFLRDRNIPSSQANPFYHEWALMYALNGAMNSVLENVDFVDMSKDKRNTIRAWAYYWKGFAYSRIGSIYIAGIINNTTNKTNNQYVAKETLLLEAEANLGKAEEILNSISVDADYQNVLDKLIPSVCKPGKGGVPGKLEWIRNINTLRARNILVNSTVASMTTEQWNQVLNLTLNGIGELDNTFTVRSDAQSNLLSTNGHVAAGTIGPESNGGGANKVSERLIQDFKPGDLRLMNNFRAISTWIGSRVYGTSFNTRYMLVDKGNGLPGVVVMCNRGIGAHELYIAGSYEENILMQAEANIYLGHIETGLSLIDELRVYLGAGLAPVAGAGLTEDEAKEELRRERRVALAFRGFAFYDARRWGVLENARSGCTVIDFVGNVHTNATINYGYLDYWDVPIAELFYNPPAPGSAPVENPKGL
ncbi:MAG: RagB/SusD family nutrient uptake outer membrane protein [Cyclobacteriaceae bacterium]